jgi:prophage antirepressor-like protein
MANIIPFEFETQALRVNLDDAGQPWFNANDLCTVLDFGNPRQALESHVDSDDVQKLDTIDILVYKSDNVSITDTICSAGCMTALWRAEAKS